MKKIRHNLHPLLLLFFLVTPCFLNAQDHGILGKYTGDPGNDTLILRQNGTFTIISDYPDSTNKMIPYELNGRFKITKHSVAFIQFDKAYPQVAYWNCMMLTRDRGILKRPLHCSPTMRLLIFTKIK